TTIMGAIILTWSCLTLAIQGRAHRADGVPNALPLAPDLNPHPDYIAGTPEHPETSDPLGFVSQTQLGDELRALHTAPAWSWLSLVGAIGVFMAFGHSILAMSG